MNWLLTDFNVELKYAIKNWKKSNDIFLKDFPSFNEKLIKLNLLTYHI